MSEHPHKFRYLLPPGSNFQFIAKARGFMFLALFLLVATVGALVYNKTVRGEWMNWTIDFRGGTEITFSFVDKADPTKYVRVDAQAVRAALKGTDEEGFDVSETSWNVEGKGTVNGMMVKTPRFAAMKPEQAAAAREAFLAAFADKKIEKARWSGERLYVRSLTSLVGVDSTAAFKSAGLDVKPWSDDEKRLYEKPEEGSGEYHSVFAVRGIDHQFEQVLEAAIPNVDAQVVESTGVGAKAGAELRNDAVKAVIYAMLLIVLYLAFRFDLRYAPGAAFATIHDAMAVVLVFAVTWTEVSL